MPTKKTQRVKNNLMVFWLMIWIKMYIWHNNNKLLESIKLIYIFLKGFNSIIIININIFLIIYLKK